MQKVMIAFDDIRIPQRFKSTQPKPEKLEACRERFINGELDRELVLTHNNVLKDGYVLYCIMKEFGADDFVEVVKPDVLESPEKFVYGHHPGKRKKYVWRTNNKKFNAQKGDKIWVDTKLGKALAIVDKVEERTDFPIESEIRQVLAW